jgi:hypothetical protein
MAVGYRAPEHGREALEDEINGDGLVHGVDALPECGGERWDGGEVDVGW